MADTTFLHHLRDEIDAEIKAQETVVTGGGGTGTLTLMPAAVKPGDLITITGLGFGTTGAVSSGNYPNSPVSWSDNLIVSRLHPDIPPGVYNVYINTVWLGLSIEVLAADDTGTGGGTSFTVGAVTPNPAHDGDLLTVPGTGFGTVEGTLMLGSTIQPLTPSSWTDTEITFVFPNLMAGEYHVSVILPNGDSRDSGPFQIVAVDTGGDTEGGGTTDLPAGAPPEPDPGSDAVSIEITAPVITRPNHRRFTMDPERPYYQLYSDWVPDDQPVVASAAKPYRGIITPGMRNGEVHAHGKMIARMVPDANGVIQSTLDLSQEYNGPLKVEHYGWDSLPGGAFQNEAKQSHWWIIQGSIDRPRPGKPPGAAGLIEAFNYNFGHQPLSVSKTDRTAIWCPSKAEQVTPTYDGHGQYGEAIFGENLFYEIPNWLRIRAQQNHKAVDPFQWNRFWESGTLSLGRPSGNGGRYAHPPLYTDVEIYAPIGVTAWPAFWANSLQSLLDGQYNLEIDFVELLSNYPNNYRSGMIRYAPGEPVQYGLGAAAERGSGIFTNDHLNWEPHRWGCLVTDQFVAYYLDDVEYIRHNTLTLPTGPTAYFIMLALAMGSGFPTLSPPGGAYDCWFREPRIFTADGRLEVR